MMPLGVMVFGVTWEPSSRTMLLCPVSVGKPNSTAVGLDFDVRQAQGVAPTLIRGKQSGSGRCGEARAVGQVEADLYVGGVWCVGGVWNVQPVGVCKGDAGFPGGGGVAAQAGMGVALGYHGSHVAQEVDKDDIVLIGLGYWLPVDGHVYDAAWCDGVWRDVGA